MRATFKGRADFERFLTLAIEHVDFLIPQEPEEAKVSVALTPAEWEEIFPDLREPRSARTRSSTQRRMGATSTSRLFMIGRLWSARSRVDFAPKRTRFALSEL
jgi:hypothetical protein